jgi:hypothetical protein
MMELSSHLSDKERERIGQIFTKLLKTDPRAYRFQQELFDQYIGVDPLFFAKTALAASFQVEQDLIEDYYHESEFETEEAVYEFFGKSEYLSKYPRLKERVIKDAIGKINGYPSEEKDEVKANTIGAELSKKAEEYNKAHGLPKRESQPIPLDTSIQKHPNSHYGPEGGKESRRKYGAAYRQAQGEFRTQGIDYPTGKTPGFRDRVQEIYEGMMGNTDDSRLDRGGGKEAGARPEKGA